MLKVVALMSRVWLCYEFLIPSYDSKGYVEKIHIIFLIPFPLLSQLFDLAVKSAILIAAWIESELSVFPSLQWIPCSGTVQRDALLEF
jgi:hypothetical protein